MHLNLDVLEFYSYWFIRDFIFGHKMLSFAVFAALRLIFGLALNAKEQRAQRY
jgi:hypothetical protein